MNKVIEIAKLVKEYGGNTYYVGGYVRDLLLNVENKDIDIEVHGIDKNKLEEILNKVGEPLSYGSSFAIYSLKDEHIDIALPRSEQKTGKGHKDFKVDIDPFIGTYKAAKRRDFTINALMKDVLSGEIIDHFNGINDLNNKTIRHIDDETFKEDSLRVLRAFGFASRLNFNIDDNTLNLCKNIDITSLSKQRVEEELKKALLQSNKPSIFFNYLKETNHLSFYFSELEKLINLKQDPIFHPEGDVYTHTMMVLDNATKYLDEVSNPFNFMLLCLCHDMGKINTSNIVNNRIHSYNHENSGLPLIESFLKRFLDNNETINYVLNMVPLHMLPNVTYKDKSSIKATNTMFYKAIAKKDLIYFALVDSVLDEKDRLIFLNERLNIYNETMKKPCVTGNDLIAHGLIPDKNFNDILSYATKLRLAGIDKDNALKQVLNYAKKFTSI